MRALPGKLERSWLFVRGDRPERFDKALASGADGVIPDLENAVAQERKNIACEAVLAALDSKPAQAVQNDREWLTFCKRVLLHADLADDQRYATNAQRNAAFVLGSRLGSCHRSQRTGNADHAAPIDSGRDGAED